MKDINTNHPNWQNHLLDLIEEKWEKRDKSSLHQRWVISYKMLGDISDDEIPSMVHGLVSPYLEEHIDSIKNFHLMQHYNENFDLVIDMKIEPLSKLSHFLA